MKKTNGKQSVEVMVSPTYSNWKQGNWSFSQNGQYSRAVNISPEQFEMMKELVNNPEVVAYYENLKQTK